MYGMSTGSMCFAAHHCTPLRMADILDWDEAEGAVIREEKALWNADWELRHRCVGLTALETKSLVSSYSWGHDEQCLQDVQKLIKFYGAESGGHASCKRLVKWVQTHYPVAAGVVAKWHSPVFSVLKHLMLAERQSHQLGHRQANSMGCKCFAKTYLMMAGCPHKQFQPHKTTPLAATLCALCSTCLRCQKLPACIGCVCVLLSS